jgi:hypothetical protein
MELQELAGQYRAKSDEELLRLALDSGQLTPEANTLLQAELAERQMRGNERLDEFRAENQQREEQEKSSKRASLFPTITRALKTLREWREYRRRTGVWPVLSMVGHVVHFAVWLAVLAFVVWYGVEHSWSKTRFLLVLLPVSLIDVFLWDNVRKAIRMREIASYRNRRHSTM